MLSIKLDQIAEEIEASLPGLDLAGQDINFLKPIDQGVMERESVKDRITEHPWNRLYLLTDETIKLLGRCMSLRNEKRDIEEKLVRWWLSHSRDKRKIGIRRDRYEAGEYSRAAAANRRALKSRGRTQRMIQELITAAESGMEWREKGNPVLERRIETGTEYTALLSNQNFERVKEASVNRERNQIEYEQLIAKQALQSARIQSEQNSLTLKNIKERQSILDKEEYFKNSEICADEDYIRNWEDVTNHSNLATDFLSRIQELTRLFDGDFGNAFGRCMAIEKGLQKLHQENIPIPDIDQENSRPLTALVLWIREVSEYLTRKRHNQTLFSWAFSTSSVTERQGEDDIAFNVSYEDLPSFIDPRLKGVQISCNKIEQGVFGGAIVTFDSEICNVSLPVMDITRHDVSSDFGRVEAYSLLNMSPIGSWRLRPDMRLKGLIRNGAEVIIRFLIEGEPK